jgi:hypothetical protein
MQDRLLSSPVTLLGYHQPTTIAYRHQDRQQREHCNRDTTSEDEINNPTITSITSDIGTRPPPTTEQITLCTIFSTYVVSRQPLYTTNFRVTLLDMPF